jgi:hypothetical protein
MLIGQSAYIYCRPNQSLVSSLDETSQINTDFGLKELETLARLSRVGKWKISVSHFCQCTWRSLLVITCKNEDAASSYSLIHN